MSAPDGYFDVLNSILDQVRMLGPDWQERMKSPDGSHLRSRLETHLFYHLSLCPEDDTILERARYIATVSIPPTPLSQSWMYPTSPMCPWSLEELLAPILKTGSSNPGLVTEPTSPPRIIKRRTPSPPGHPFDPPQWEEQLSKSSPCSLPLPGAISPDDLAGFRPIARVAVSCSSCAILNPTAQCEFIDWGIECVQCAGDLQRRCTFKLGAVDAEDLYQVQSALSGLSLHDLRQAIQRVDAAARIARELADATETAVCNVDNLAEEVRLLVFRMLGNLPPPHVSSRFTHMEVLHALLGHGRERL